MPDRLPPGQYIPRVWPVLHYGRVPRFDPATWTLQVCGTATQPLCWSWSDFARLPRVDVIADLHCVTKFTLLGNRWTGVSTAQLLAAAPPAPGVEHVMVYGEYGYSANLRLSDFASSESLLATHRNGELLTPEHGYPVRLVVPHLYAWKGPKWVRGVEYLTEDRRGFWEKKGYHNLAIAWREQRYSYQEHAGDAAED